MKTRRQLDIVIPARMSSTRLPNKIIMPLGNMPLILRTYQSACQVKSELKEHQIEANIIVAVESDKTKEAILKHDSDVNVVICPDANSGTERAMQACTSNFLLVWQADWPLINRSDLVDMIVNSHGDIANIWTMAIRVRNTTPIANNKNLVKVVVSDSGRAIYFSRSPVPYNSSELLIHSGIYLMHNVEDIKTLDVVKLDQFAKLEDLEQLKYLSCGITINCRVYDRGIYHGVDTRPEYEYYSQIVDKIEGIIEHD